MKNKPVAIVGAGLAGSLMAALLGERGYEVTVFEMRGDPRRTQVPRGRSINLAISTRGLTALRRIGLDTEILKSGVPMKGRMIHSAAGKTTFQAYDRTGQAINSVSRGDLNIALIEAAEQHASVEFLFDHRLKRFDLDDQVLEFELGDPVTVESYRAGVVIGADGGFSSVRRPMLRTDGFSYSQDYLEHGYKELTIPAGAGGAYELEKNALHIWPRGGYMMIALPNADGSFTCTLFWPMTGENGLDSLTTPAEVEAFFKLHFPDAVPHMPTLADDFLHNPNSSLATFRCWPWHCGKTALIGDAAHGVVPFYGQGANASFEDCGVLIDCLEEAAGDWELAFERFEARRKTHVDTIADLAISNFIEMRDNVGSGTFLLKKKVEKLIQGVVPFWYTPLYTMISFSNIPYAEAVEKSKRQDRALRNVFNLVLAAVIVLGVLLIH